MGCLCEVQRCAGAVRSVWLSTGAMMMKLTCAGCYQDFEAERLRSWGNYCHNCAEALRKVGLGPFQAPNRTQQDIDDALRKAGAGHRAFCIRASGSAPKSRYGPR